MAITRAAAAALGAVLAVLPVTVGACRSDRAHSDVAPSGSAAVVAPDLDTTALKVAPTLAELAGWWMVPDGFVAEHDEPGNRAGSAWWFGPTAIRLVFGDAHDKRNIASSTVDDDTLHLNVGGADLPITRRRGGVAIQLGHAEARVPLRRATPSEVAVLDRADALRGRMLERACEKALECCGAARGKGIAREDDCKPLLGPPDLARCIEAVALYKRKAATANVTLPECLPDK